MSFEPASSARVELARAKVNLALLYHRQAVRRLSPCSTRSWPFRKLATGSLFEAAAQLDLQVEGPFARDLGGPSTDNLILKAVNGFAEKAGIALPSVRLTLTKRLPVASGIGGGSSDAATTLRLLEDFTGTYLSEEDMQALALALGADVPVCLYPEPQRMRGIGEGSVRRPGTAVLRDCAGQSPGVCLHTEGICRAGSTG